MLKPLLEVCELPSGHIWLERLYGYILTLVSMWSDIFANIPFKTWMHWGLNQFVSGYASQTFIAISLVIVGFVSWPVLTSCQVSSWSQQISSMLYWMLYCMLYSMLYVLNWVCAVKMSPLYHSLDMYICTICVENIKYVLSVLGPDDQMWYPNSNKYQIPKTILV